MYQNDHRNDSDDDSDNNNNDSSNNNLNVCRKYFKGRIFGLETFTKLLLTQKRNWRPGLVVSMGRPHESWMTGSENGRKTTNLTVSPLTPVRSLGETVSRKVSTTVLDSWTSIFSFVSPSLVKWLPVDTDFPSVQEGAGWSWKEGLSILTKSLFFGVIKIFSLI